MLAGVAHDLRNPMTAISGYAQLMALEVDAKIRQERCERVLAQIDEMTAMIADTRLDTEADMPRTDAERQARGPAQARGIADRMMDGVTLVDYNGFVDLVAEHKTCQSWL